MPVYNVKRKGVHAGVMYDPTGKRPQLITDKPFPSKKVKGKPVEQVPSWLERCDDETSAQREAREDAEATNKEQVAQGDADVKAASTEAPSFNSTTVETV